MPLCKYFATIRIGWENGFVYRLNFLMWRFRSLIQLLVLYFLWVAIFRETNQISGYALPTILTYILGTSVLRSLVLGSRSSDISSEIATGDLSNTLVKPINYFGFWLSRDLADKVLNLLFSGLELTGIIILLRPPLFFQDNFLILMAFVVSVVLALFLYFLMSFLISSVTFWYPEHNGWPARFLSLIIIEFLAGGVFPLDIFPDFFFRIVSLLPPAYFLFFPLQLYLGRLDFGQTLLMFIALAAWIVVLWLISASIWKKGLKTYGAYGR